MSADLSAGPAVTAIRGAALTFRDDPFLAGVDAAMVYEPDAALVMENGVIAAFGPADKVLATQPPDLVPVHYRDSLILPGFIDSHVHYPQTPIIGSYGTHLIEWLDKYAFVAEQSFADREHAGGVAAFFLRELLRNGTTSAAVYCTVHPGSVDALFEQAAPLGMRLVAGKMLMDRNAPAALTDTAQSAYDDSKRLIERWHGKGRALYCITPRFAPTSTPAQLEAAGALWREFPGTYVQSHLSENVEEVVWVKELFPESAGYLDVYDRFGLLGPRAVYGHAIHLSEAEFRRCHETGTAFAHCPTSNLFLGSGLFHVETAKQAARPVRTGLATDVGGGTSLSMLRTLAEAYKIAQMNGYSLSPAHAFYLATRGSAEALYLEDRIGSLAEGSEADIVVLDLHSTPAIRYRMQFADGIEETLFVQMIMADDRAVRATYVAGRKVHDRDAETSA